MDIKKLDQFLKFNFSNLNIKGTNIEKFYSIRFERFLFHNSELSFEQKMEVIATGQLNGKSEPTIQKVLSERNFIQHELVRSENYLKESIDPDNREKLLIWIDYLEQRDKANAIIKPKVRKWDNPLVALYCVYSGFQITEQNREEITTQLRANNSPDIIKQYNKYQKAGNRIFSNFIEEDRRLAEAQLKRLENLKLIMEDKGEKGSGAYEKLLSDIEALKKNINHI